MSARIGRRIGETGRKKDDWGEQAELDVLEVGVGCAEWCAGQNGHDTLRNEQLLSRRRRSRRLHIGGGEQLGSQAAKQI